MINKLATNITDFFVRKNIVDKGEGEIYVYRFDLLLSGMEDNKGYCYSYSKEGFDIKLEYNNAETGCITINGNKIALDYTKEVHEDNPQVVVKDVNGDGKVDIYSAF